MTTMLTVCSPVPKLFPPTSAPTCIFIFFYLLFTRFWLVSVLYAIWWFFDYDTPALGGRKVSYLCGLKLWEHMKDYFPIKVRDCCCMFQGWI